MAESLKELIERRNKAVADAREILGRPSVSADDKLHADRLLDKAGEDDAKIEEHRKDAGRQARLDELAAKQTQDAPRQIPPVGQPGDPTPRRPVAEAALSVQLGRHTVSLRPGTDAHRRASDESGERYAAYLKGDYSGSNGHERLGLVVGDNSKGGYAAPMAMLAGLIKFLDDAVFMRQLATVLPPTDQKSVGALSYDTDPGDADWTAEVTAADLSEDDTARFGKRELTPHLLTKLLKMSRKILRNASLDIYAFMVQRLGYKFSITEEKAFLLGNGVGGPLGVFVASADGLTTSQDVPAAGSTAVTGDDFINCLYDLKEAYMRNATWLLSRAIIKMARKLKSTDNQYIWSPGLNGQPGLLLDRPYVMSEYVPSTFTTGLYVAAVGDFKAGYYIQDGLNFETQRIEELFTLKGQVGVLASKETDGMPVLPEAMRRLKLA